VIEALFAGALTWLTSDRIRPSPAMCDPRVRPCALLQAPPAAEQPWLFVSPLASAKPEDFHGKKIATPQLGNTQDVALRAWLQAHNLKTRDKGGDVLVIPIANPDQLTLFLKGEIDAAWAPEPWTSRLIQEANAASSWMSATSGPIASSSPLI